VQQVSGLHLKFALRPQHVWKYGKHLICSRLKLGEEKEDRRKKKKNDRIKI